VARNRKRRSAARTRRPSGGAAAQPGVATASGARPEDDAPDPLEHATPDVELAEAQLAVGRPEYADGELPADEPLGDGEDGGYDEGGDDSEPDGGSGGRRSASAGVTVRRPSPGVRLVEFLRGSWRELQRVQWPDRRQVVQATGVVIGFVIVAGVYLGVADLVASKVVKLILP
jgi:preprotein translocase subunit SecE